ncbi:MAG: ribonuclease HII [Actinobacteria bacterium]|uniref:Ribonuclease HII n=1 Tax=freshwater metagenome TaxID=449393 RepID=A0A6J6D163_9ZZZZ|nr:ribonuclease HII [Actinomycetota bacterium]
MSSKTFPSLDSERRIFERGNRFVIGIDEVGRGAIAGPVAVGVSLIDKTNPALEAWPEKLQDSKLMTPKSRSEIASPLIEWVSSYAVGFSSNKEIDQLGISEALRLAAGSALDELFKDAKTRKRIAEDGAVILLDGSQNWLGKVSYGLDVQVQVKADTNCVSVAAAAVLAKVTRDSLMQELDTQNPGYGLAGHKGYASAAHIAALRARGPTDIHRVTWLTRILA